MHAFCEAVHGLVLCLLLGGPLLLDVYLAGTGRPAGSPGHPPGMAPRALGHLARGSRLPALRRCGCVACRPSSDRSNRSRNPLTVSYRHTMRKHDAPQERIDPYLPHQHVSALDLRRCNAGHHLHLRSRRLELAAIGASLLAMLSCLLGLLLGALAIVTLWASRSGRMPGWGTSFGFCLLVCGSYLILRLVLVDA